MWKKAFKAVLLKFYLVHSWMYCLILTSVKFRILVGFQVPTLPQIFWGTLIIHLCSQICHLCCRLSHHLYHQQLCVWFAHQSSERCSIEDHLGQCWWKVSLRQQKLTKNLYYPTLQADFWDQLSESLAASFSHVPIHFERKNCTLRNIFPKSWLNVVFTRNIYPVIPYN